MAGKEATVYIVDCGASMGESSAGRQESNLDFALQYVWDKLTSTVATGRKTLLAGVVGLGTDGTDNELASDEDESYNHLSVYMDLQQLLMPNLRKLRDQLVLSGTEAGDAISALVLAIQMIAQTCKKLAYQRRIVLVTDARGRMEVDELQGIVKKLKEDSIELVVLGVDFDDADYGFKEEDKDETKAENEAILKTLCEDCNGVFGTLTQAVDELGVPRIKSTKPVPLFKGTMTLGDPENYETALSIKVERYPKVMQAKPPSASKFVIKGDMSTQETQTSGTLSDGTANDGLAAVKNARTYQVEDSEAPGGKRDVEYDELAKGYEYGRTAVHISESDRNVTTYETSPGLDILGFVDRNLYNRYLDMDRTSMILPAKTDDKSSMALSSLIHALYELDSYAVARLVSKENNQPKILLLAPNIEPDFECLYDIEMPFAEDIRSYKFPPLDRVVTVSGKVLSLHRNLPSSDLQSAMDRYVDAMDLSTLDRDEEGDEKEYASPDETYSPMLHRINQVIKHRAIFPTGEPPETMPILTKFANPPEELIKRSQPALSTLIKAAEVKKVPPKARGKRFGRGRKGEAEKPLSDLDIGALLKQDPGRKTQKIDPKNAVPEFRQIVETAEDISTLRDAVNQLQEIIFDQIKHSVGDSGYGQAVEGIRVMREEMIEMEEPGLFNEFLKELKSKVLDGQLGGERREMWFKVRVNRLGLVQKRECEASEVDEDEAKSFMMAR